MPPARSRLVRRFRLKAKRVTLRVRKQVPMSSDALGCTSKRRKESEFSQNPHIKVSHLELRDII